MPPVDYLIYAVCYNVLLIVTFVIGWIYFRRSQPLTYKLLFILSGATMVLEVVVFFMILNRKSNEKVYNLFSPLETATLLFIFYKGSTQVAIKRLNVTLLSILPVGCMLFYILQPELSKMNIGIYLFYLFLELISACSLLIDVFLNKASVNLRQQPLIWLAIGMLSFCSIFILYHLLMNFFLERGIYRYFMLYSALANSCMYGGFIACFAFYNRLAPKGAKAMLKENEEPKK